jgi:hypothetical protein
MTLIVTTVPYQPRTAAINVCIVLPEPDHKSRSGIIQKVIDGSP